MAEAMVARDLTGTVLAVAVLLMFVWEVILFPIVSSLVLVAVVPADILLTVLMQEPVVVEARVAAPWVSAAAAAEDAQQAEAAAAQVVLLIHMVQVAQVPDSLQVVVCLEQAQAILVSQAL